MRKVSLLLILTMFVALVSCEKYPDGGLVKKGDDRLEGTWKLSTYLRNGTNETSLLTISGYMESYKAGGIFSRSYTPDGSALFEETGDWSIASDNLTVSLTGISSISNFSNANSTVSYNTITISKLDKKEYWYEFENGGDLHEFRFTKQ